MDDEDPSPTLQQTVEEAGLTEAELDLKYPNRPRNHGSFPFYKLYESLFNPLSETKKRPGGAQPGPRRKQGPHGPKNLSPKELKRSIVREFISRWRREVGDDVYPAFRLIIPDKDKERAMYGLKEKTIAKLLVRLVKIDKNSDDALNLLNWKLPGQRSSTMMAGDFAGRCYQVLSRRAVRTQPSGMSVDEVNQKLDELSDAQREDSQLTIMEHFYRKMNAEEMMWLIRIILRQMKIGATERTFFDLWHPDADMLFNISSNLRRVCWELADPSVKLVGEETEITLMQCFQPQLAQFQMSSFEKMVQRMLPTEDDDEFWIEEKLDGERMQLHMMEDIEVDGGKRFGFWSRKAKDYTYLYGNGFQDEGRALTKYLKEAFDENVRNIILDGEMITWNPATGKMEPFGTLKTAALNERDDPDGNKTRPLYRVFDILYLNDQPLTRFTLRDRRNALQSAIRDIPRRFELHRYDSGHTVTDIEPHLRKVVAEAFEGLVLKNPRSAYRLNSRNDDWMKVKPEYMTGFGEEMDCVVIGGYYGSGKRGGFLSSFLCGVRAPTSNAAGDSDSELFLSCFKVGGGFTAADYTMIHHRTEGKWHDWNRKDPPNDYIRLAGSDLQYEQPDAWIRPSESVVIAVKAASITKTSQFATGHTLRFPRFKRVRPDKEWRSSLTSQEFEDLRNERDREEQEKRFTFEQKRRQQPHKRQKRAMVVAGALDQEKLNDLMPEVDAAKDLFSGLTFFIISDSVSAPKKTRHEIEAFVKGHGASITHSISSKASKDRQDRIICIADRNVVKVSSLVKEGSNSIIRPRWLYDCVEQAKRDIAMGREAMLLPWEPRHALFVSDKDKEMIGSSADEWSDGYARDITCVVELRQLMDDMPAGGMGTSSSESMFRRLVDGSGADDDMPSRMFRNCVVWFDDGREGDSMDVDSEPLDFRAQQQTLEAQLNSNLLRFAGGELAGSMQGDETTHIVVAADSDRLRSIRSSLQSRRRLPHLVTTEWIPQSWAEKTLLDEERFMPT